MNYKIDNPVIIAEHLKNKNKTLSALKVTAVIYYTYGIYLIKHNKFSYIIKNILFKENFIAGVMGPRLVSLDVAIDKGIVSKNHKIDSELDALIDKVLLALSDKTENEILEMLKSEDAWLDARKGVKFFEESNNIVSKHFIFKSAHKRCITMCNDKKEPIINIDNISLKIEL